jgi:hypothetical protein
MLAQQVLQQYLYQRGSEAAVKAQHAPLAVQRLQRVCCGRAVPILHAYALTCESHASA